MKINTELLKAVQEQEVKKNTTQEQNQEKFQEVLNQNINTKQSSGKYPQFSQQISGAQMTALHTQIQTNSISSPESSSPTDLGEKFDQVLDQWENYSQKLQSPNHSLRSSYQTLEEITENMRQIKDELPANEQHNSEYKSILNELEILAETEKIKVNRGDYH